jgi:pre-mRNA-processing factor 17
MQEYNYHLGAVNSVTFIDPPSGSRFVTTSDDKTIRMWEFGIPVQVGEGWWGAGYCQLPVSYW